MIMSIGITLMGTSSISTGLANRKERRTIKIGDTLQKAYVSLGGDRLVWLDITRIDNATDMEQAKRLCLIGTISDEAKNVHFVRVVGVRDGKRYSVGGYNIGKPA